MPSYTKRKHCFIDFCKQPRVPFFNASSAAFPTAAAGQVDFFYIGNQYFEIYQSTANSGFATPTITTGGWEMPVAASAGGIELGTGILAGQAMTFTVGVDPAFYMRMFFDHDDISDNVVTAIGFREFGAYAACGTEAEFKTAYDNKATIGFCSNAATSETNTSLATVDVDTNLALAAPADTNWCALEVNVSGAGVVTYRIGKAAGGTVPTLAADANAVAFTFAAGTVVSPAVWIANANAGGASTTQLQTLEFGHIL